MLANAGKCWQMLANASKCWRMLANAGKCWQMLANTGKCWQMQANASKYWQIIVIQQHAPSQCLLLKGNNFQSSHSAAALQVVDVCKYYSLRGSDYTCILGCANHVFYNEACVTNKYDYLKLWNNYLHHCHDLRGDYFHIWHISYID